MIESHLSFKNPFNNLKLKILKEIIEKFKINIVHILKSSCFFYANYLKQNFDIKLITSIHNPFENKNFLKNFYNKSILKGDIIICNSFYVKDYIERKYCPSKKLYL